MFRILSKITDYFYITDSITEEPSNLSDYEVTCRILGKEFCSDLSKSIEEIKYSLQGKILREEISSQDISRILKIVDSLSEERNEDLFYKNICEICLQKKNFDQALYSTTFIKDKYIASNLIEILSLDLVNEGRIAEALRVVNSIDFDSKKAMILRRLCIEVASQNPYACFPIIACFPESDQCKDATLIELAQIFTVRKESTNFAEEKSVCNQLVLQCIKMLDYDTILPIKI